MQASKEYAEALFCLAAEENSEEVYFSALTQVLKVIEQNPEYIEFLACPGIAVNERTDAIKQAFKSALPQNVLNFLCILCEKGHIKELKECADEFNELYKASKRIVSTEVISAVSLSDEQKQRLIRKLENLYGCSVQAHCSVDKSLLGGVVVKVDGKVIDSSIKHRLQRIKEVID